MRGSSGQHGEPQRASNGFWAANQALRRWCHLLATLLCPLLTIAQQTKMPKHNKSRGHDAVWREEHLIGTTPDYRGDLENTRSLPHLRARVASSAQTDGKGQSEGSSDEPHEPPFHNTTVSELSSTTVKQLAARLKHVAAVNHIPAKSMSYLRSGVGASRATVRAQAHPRASP